MLQIRNLQASIGGTPILRNVTLALQSGHTGVLVGRNGAGKTTTLRTVMGLIRASAGAVELDGKDLLSMPAFARVVEGIGYAPEDRRLIPEFTVGENIELPVLALNLPSAERRRRLDEVYALLPELKEMRGRSGAGLSGGQGKMVALGRALTVARKALLLDEPFQGLAPALALNYARVLGRLRQARPDLTLLITESSPKLLREITDEIVTIDRGEVVQAGAIGLDGGAGDHADRQIGVTGR